MSKHLIVVLLLVFWNSLAAQTGPGQKQEAKTWTDRIFEEHSIDTAAFLDTASAVFSVPPLFKTDSNDVPVDLPHLKESGITDYPLKTYPLPLYPKDQFFKNMLPAGFLRETDTSHFQERPEIIDPVENISGFSSGPVELFGENPDGPGELPGVPHPIPVLDRLQEFDAIRNISPAQIDQDFFSDESFRLLPGKLIPDTVFNVMDSVRKAVPASRDLLRRELLLEEGLKKVTFSNKATFWDRTYLEGIIGLEPGTARVRNVSPALGHYLSRKMSVGLGPSINLGNPKDVLKSAIGTRSFLKYELLQRKAYLQTENLSHLNRIKNPAREKSRYGKIDHSLYLGAGYQVPVANTVSLNVLMLYDLNPDPGPDRQTSPFNVRLGMSSFKPVE